MNAPARGGDSAFEVSAIERQLALRGSRRARLGPRQWRWLGTGALLGLLALLALAWQLAQAPVLDMRFAADADGRWVLQAGERRELAPYQGAVLQALGPAGPGAAPHPALDGLGARWFQPSARWIVDEAARERQRSAQRALAELGRAHELRLHFADGRAVDAALSARGLDGLGWAFWPPALAALALGLLALGVALAQPGRRNRLYALLAGLQAAGLLFVAADTAPGLAAGLAPLAGVFGDDLPWRLGIDAATAAAVLHALALHPRPLPEARRRVLLGWGVAALAWGLALAAPAPAGPWRWLAVQAACLAAAAVAAVQLFRAWRRENDPYLAVLARLSVALLLAIAAASALALAGGTRTGAGAPAAAQAAAALWAAAMTAVLLYLPFVASSRQVLREATLLAAAVALAATLNGGLRDLLPGPPATSALLPATLALVLAAAAYAAARRWLAGRLASSAVLSTERAFEQLYRAARELQARPGRYPEVLEDLLRALFDPLQVLPVQARGRRPAVVGGGAALVVPLRAAPDLAAQGSAAEGTDSALVLRSGRRGQRLFTHDDARLAQRLIEQLQRAVAYDQAVERGRSEERQRIAQDLHDDIGARLLTLMYQAQTPEMEDYIRHTLKDLKTLTRGLASTDHRLSHAAAEWKADLTQRLTAAQVELAWQLQMDRDLTLSMVQWSALTRILRELVSNALHHAEATRVEVALVLQQRRLTLRVADDGQGRAPERWSHGLGLGGVRKRVKLLGGEVIWRENAPRGIVCEVQVHGFG